MKIESPAFRHGADIPSDHTCDGVDRSPALKWSDVPAGAQSFALIADDPDAPVGTWVHWVLYDLPADLKGIPEGAAGIPGQSGMTDFRRPGYGGPCPPQGKHRYYFKLYALDRLLELPAGATKKELLKAMEGHVLEEAVLMGTYQRKR